MKRLFFSFTCLLAQLANAQVDPACIVGPGVTLGSTIHLEYNPSLLEPDIWANPELIEDRRVFFVHGLGGQGDEDGTTGISWAQASLWCEQQYYINSARPDYNNISLEAAAVELKSDFESFPDADNSAIVIAHSQGGIVSRRVDQMYTTGEYGWEPRTFGGLVTFGTPHQGAAILSNIEEVEDWIGDGCVDLSAGPVAEFVENSFFLDLLLGPESYAGFTEEFCGTIENQVLPFLLDDYLAGTTSAYSTDAEYLAALNSFVPEIPYVCFYGVEDDPVLWKLLVHLFPGREPNNAVTYGEAAFGATNDETAVEWADAMIAQYWSKYLIYDDLYDYYNELLTGFDMATILCYINPVCFVSALASREDCLNISNAYQQGYDWINNANTVWEELIGARTLEPTETWCSCMDWGPLGDLEMEEYLADASGDCYTDDADTDCTTTQMYDWRVKRNDGVVLVESASECLGQTANGTLFKEMEGSNHFSMRNDNNTKQKLINLYSGLYGNFYKTSER